MQCSTVTVKIVIINGAESQCASPEHIALIILDVRAIAVIIDTS